MADLRKMSLSWGAARQTRMRLNGVRLRPVLAPKEQDSATPTEEVHDYTSQQQQKTHSLTAIKFCYQLLGINPMGFFYQQKG